MGFEILRTRLLQGGIAPRHVRRYLTELSEHLDDLARQQRDAGYDAEDAASRARARLGSDDELASAMLEQKHLRSITARAPWAVFLLLPPVAGIAAAFALIAPLVLAAKMGRMTSPEGLHAPLWFQQMAAWVTMFGNLALAPCLAMAFIMLAVRQRMAATWAVCAVCVLALLDIQFEALFPPAGQTGGTLSIGAAAWMTHPGSMVSPWPLALVQLALTLMPLLFLNKIRARHA